MPRKYHNALIVATNITYDNNWSNITYTIPLISDFNLSTSITRTSTLTRTSVVIARTKIDATSRVAKSTVITTPKKGAKGKRPRDTVGKNKVSSKAPRKTTTSKGAATTTRK